MENSTYLFSVPLQLKTTEEKNKDDKKFYRQTVDALERIAIRQIQENAKHYIKNYKIAEGVLDISDYIPSSDNQERLNTLSDGYEGKIDYSGLLFYPIAPNIINTLEGEYGKRFTNYKIKSVDEFTVNETLKFKNDMVSNMLIQKAKIQFQMKLAQQGLTEDGNPEEYQKQMDQMMSLPEIQNYMNTDYRSELEQWAEAKMEEANHKFEMEYLERKSFRQMLVNNRPFWHIRVRDNNYYPELWSEVETAYIKSPSTECVSDGFAVMKTSLLDLPTIVNTFGYLMDEEQIKACEQLMPNYLIGEFVTPTERIMGSNFDKNNPWALDDAHKSGLMAFRNIKGDSSSILDILKRPGEETRGLLRVSEVYWKSQRRLGELTVKGEDGTLIMESTIVGDNYKVRAKPKYDTRIEKEKTKDNLLSGEHIEWFWVPQTCHAIKIGIWTSSIYMQDDIDKKTAPIYLDLGPIDFEFKGETSVYGSKIPVIGGPMGSKHTSSHSLVDLIRPWQVDYNLIWNQIREMLTTEIGKFLLFDQNWIPRNSFDGSWGGKFNLQKFYQVAKDVSLAPIDSTITNTEIQTGMQNAQAVDITKTEQILSRANLARAIKEECFSVLGITPQRMGTIQASETATGVTQAVNNSYAQTESYFLNHFNLMKRVKTMMLNAAQYIESKNPESITTYVNKDQQNIILKVDGTKLLLGDLQIFVTNSQDDLRVLESLRQLAMSNNTSGASIEELAVMLKSNSVSEIMNVLKDSTARTQQQQQAEQEHEQELQQEQLQHMQELEDKKLAHDDYQRQLDRQLEILLAEIKAQGYAKNTDINQDQIPDVLEVAQFEADLHSTNQDLLLKKQQEYNKLIQQKRDSQQKSQELDLAHEKLKTELTKSKNDKEIALKTIQKDKEIAKLNASVKKKQNSKKK
jgi:hypothetical protein